MPLELTYTIHPDYLEVHVHGERQNGHELEEAIALWAEVFSISNQQDSLKILAHNHVRGRFPVKAQIDLSFKIHEMGCTIDHRIAVIPHNRQVSKNAQLIVRFMQSKGFTIQFFRSKEKAKKWLLQPDKTPSFQGSFDFFK